jgi:hypothetical protein
MAGGADVGGDGSVQWHVWADNVKPGHLLNNPKPPKGYEQGHVDDTAFDVTKFKISIEIPPDPGVAADFLAAVAKAAANAQPGPGARLDFELPIIKDDYDQIRIRWDSYQGPAAKGPNAMATIIAAAKAREAASSS